MGFDHPKDFEESSSYEDDDSWILLSQEKAVAVLMGQSGQLLPRDIRMKTPIVLPSLSRREAIIDALHRAILGIDTNDTDMFHSALVRGDPLVDLNGVLLKGIKQIDKRLIHLIGPMDTSNTISNIRVNVKDGEDTATLTAHSVAQHNRPGEGLELTSRKFVTAALYYLDLVEDHSDGLWKIQKWIIRWLWRDGDKSVMLRS